MKSIVVCVEFDDFLAVTLPRNARHFEETLVVTSPQDIETHKIANVTPRCRLLTTDAFYRKGAAFNKGLAMEEGFDILGRKGWICIWDADIVMPAIIHIPDLDLACLYGPKRRILLNPQKFSDDLDWSSLDTPTQANEFVGYFQLFHASAITPPWYSIDWKHAGGCDSDFQAKFTPEQLRRTPFDVLHLGLEGEADTQQRIGINWCGRVSPRIDGGKTHARASERKDQVCKVASKRIVHGTSGERL